MRETSINSLIPSADIELLLWPGTYWKRTLWGVVMSFRYWNKTKLYPHVSACLCVHMCLLFFLQVVHQRWFGHLHIFFFYQRLLVKYGLEVKERESTLAPFPLAFLHFSLIVSEWCLERILDSESEDLVSTDAPSECGCVTRVAVELSERYFP